MRPGLRDVEVSGSPTQCTWAHPLPGRTLRITYPDIRTTDDEGRSLTLLTGLRDNSVGTRVPVDVEVLLGERALAHSHRDRRGWQALALPASEEPRPLTLEIASRDPGRRHFCFRFEYR